MDEEDKIKKALLKKALSYSASETIEEYSLEEGEEVLVKKKVTKKHFAPDVSAVKILLERYYKTYQERLSLMSDEEIALLEKLLAQKKARKRDKDFEM